MNVLVPLAAVGGLFLLGLLGGAPGMDWIFGVVLPYLAVALFFGGLIYRVMSWANVPVPFRIPTTCGQQKSLPWIKQDKLENPHNRLTTSSAGWPWRSSSSARCSGTRSRSCVRAAGSSTGPTCRCGSARWRCTGRC